MTSGGMRSSAARAKQVSRKNGGERRKGRAGSVPLFCFSLTRRGDGHVWDLFAGRMRSRNTRSNRNHKPSGGGGGAGFANLRFIMPPGVTV